MNKNIVEELKEDKNCKKKVFTKRKVKDIINKDYNPLKVNYRLIYKRRDGLYNMENKELEEIERILNWREKMLAHIFSRTFIKIYKKGIEKGFNSKM